MDDLISREAAFEAIARIRNHIWGVDIPHPTVPEYIEHHHQMQKLMEFCDEMRKKVEQLPSAQSALDEWCTDCKEYDTERHCCPRWNRVIRSTLNDAQTERKTGKWIPCSERLPDTDDKVLCCSVTKKGVRNVLIGYYYGDRWACGMNSNVVAWMPLPEPWEGDLDGTQM